MAAPTRTPRRTWVEQGLRALAAGGPDAVRIEPLAQALGVTRGGFYWHFADRRALTAKDARMLGSGMIALLHSDYASACLHPG